jgi:adenosylcobinamide-GDP ribazoletransferase
MRRFLSAVSFLSVIPAGPGGAFDPRLLSRSLAFFSIVGGLFGGVLALFAAALLRFLSPLVSAVLTVAAWTAFSGALHLDGLADTADAFGGSRDRKRRLAIMKDSRIGTFGAVAVCLILLVKTVLLAELGGGGGRALSILFGGLPSALVLSPVIGRTVMAAAIALFPSAKITGLGSAFKAHCRAVDVVVCALIAAAIAVVFRGVWGLALFAGVGAAGLLAAAGLSRGLGGLTGDSYGALCEGSEVLSLLALVFLPVGGLAG